ncbi:hypothetical protein CPB85DRAFT_1373494 [Mucidula mucida]|nr:hypothetical protein CPB85DRAFT_1373494 [Mucidula mucida]
MGEVVNVAVAFLVIVFIFRWATSSSDASDADKALGFRPKKVTQEMVDTVASMFPDIPPDNIRYDLLRSGSVETTSNRVLERGFLDPPPQGYYTLYPRTTANAPGAPPQARQAAQAAPQKPKETLISRFALESRMSDADPIPDAEVGGKAIWEDSAAKREASLRERKAKMILAARQRMLEQEKNKAS